MSKAEKFLSLERDIDSLRNGHQRFLAHLSNNGNCDKHAFKFGADSRFSSFSTTVILETLTGYYGNSSCSTFLHFQDVEVVKKAFQKYINLHMQEILSGMADILEEEASTAKEEYKAKLKAELERLEQPQEVTA